MTIQSSELAIGIDLGTTNSAMAIVGDAGRPEIIPCAEGGRLVPSVIYFGADGPIVGETAKGLQSAGAEDIAAFFKRDIGDTNFAPIFRGTRYSAVDLSALVLAKLKLDAEVNLGRPVTRAVITVPAYFNHAQRGETVQAAQQCGLQVTRLINEPTAAALAYGGGKPVKPGIYLVYDLGGGTFDVTVLSVSGDQLSVLATDGDSRLGGKDWDDRILQFLAGRFIHEFGVDPFDDPLAVNDLMIQAENAKRTLSELESTHISIHHEGHLGRYELQRSVFEDITSDLVERTRDLVEHALEEAGANWKSLEALLLVGGSTRMPMVRNYVTRMSGLQPATGMNPDEAVALGAAWQAAIDAGGVTAGSQMRYLPAVLKFTDVTSHGLGMVTENADRSHYLNTVIIRKNTPIPAQETRPFVLNTQPYGPNTCEVFVTQGEDQMPGGCVFLGKYTIRDIPHDPSGSAVLDITYRYDVNGLAGVTAELKSSGQALEVAVEPLPEDMGWVELPPSQLASKGGSAEICLLIDVSGSMAEEPLEEAQRAAVAFLDQCDFKRSSVAVVSFGTNAKRHCGLTDDPRTILAAISSLKINGSTAMAQGLDEARKALGDIGPRFIVLLTDGVPNDRDAARKSAQRLQADGVDIVAIGTNSADHDYLRELASTDQGAIFISGDGVVSAFSTIARAISTGGESFRGSVMRIT